MGRVTVHPDSRLTQAQYENTIHDLFVQEGARQVMVIDDEAAALAAKHGRHRVVGDERNLAAGIQGSPLLALEKHLAVSDRHLGR